MCSISPRVLAQLAALADTPVDFDSVGIAVNTSIGTASYCAPETLEDLLARADQRLYQAKQNGRNRVCVA